jgi:hypothetical protein
LGVLTLPKKNYVSLRCNDTDARSRHQHLAELGLNI